jgi:hypothetical protein
MGHREAGRPTVFATFRGHQGYEHGLHTISTYAGLVTR